MALFVALCGGAQPAAVLDSAPAEKVVRMSAVPTRAELRALDALAREILPVDPTPSLEEITARPDVRHLGDPAPAPQREHLPEPLRVVVCGDDAALSAVITRAMRADYLWAEIGFIPVDPGGSAAARGWGLPADSSALADIALRGPARPTPLARNDAGLAVAGSAGICGWSGGPLTAEIIVDDHVLLRQDAEGARRRGGVWGARLVPMLRAPGIAAAAARGPLDGQPVPERPKGLMGRLGLMGSLGRKLPSERGAVDPESLASGRAVQAGGPSLRVIVDGVSAPRPVQRVTFYRHLRDVQVARPCGAG